MHLGIGLDHQNLVLNLLDLDILRLEILPWVISNDTLTDPVEFALTEVFITLFTGKKTV